MFCFLSPTEPGLKPIAIPSYVQQVVLFTKGIWGKRTSVTVELSDEKSNAIISGKLTPKNK